MRKITPLNALGFSILSLGIGHAAVAACIENTTKHEVWAWISPGKHAQQMVLAPGSSICYEGYTGTVQVSIRNHTVPTYGSVRMQPDGDVRVTRDALISFDVNGEPVIWTTIGGRRSG